MPVQQGQASPNRAPGASTPDKTVPASPDRLFQTFPPRRTEIEPELQVSLKRAVACHQAGDFAQAERLYKNILGAMPDQFDALHFLGVLERQRGRHAEACRLIRRALEINPHSAEAHSNLGNALQAAEHHIQALACYERALAIKPKYAGALVNRGNTFLALNRHKEALVSYDKALEIQPSLADALNNRGAALAALKRPAEAITSYDRALAIKPDYADALGNRGLALEMLGRLQEAIASYDSALALKGGHAVVLNNRGNTLQALNRQEEALASYDRALAIAPHYLDALNNRGSALLALNRVDEAIASYDKALAINPDYVGALSNRGKALQALNRHEEALASYDRALAREPGLADTLSARAAALAALGRPSEAIASCDKALAIKPGYADALSNRGVALEALHRLEEAVASYDKALAIEPRHATALMNRANALHALIRHDEAQESIEELLRIEPDYSDARGMLLHLQMHCCDWSNYADEVERLTKEVRAEKRCTTPFAFLGVSDSARDQLQCARTYARDKFPASPALWNKETYAHDRIRLAYLSADFHDHATAFLTAELFERHDHTRFETTAISFGPDARSQMRSRLEAAFEHFVDVGNKGDHETASLLRRLEIDIAVDLKGFTASCRPKILACRPAPIQVSYLGYPGTMGVDYIDYILADRFVIPEEHHDCYAEKVVYLPDSYQVNDSKRRIAERIPARSQVGLPENAFVFCSFNSSYKITPMVFEVWMRLLRAVDGSVLWLAESNASASGNLRQQAMTSGIAPERLIFAPFAKLEDHLARHRLADLFLDTLPINAHTTASDALWAGLPVVTCLGGTFAGRVAGSLLHALGLPELVTHSLGQYEALALKLATDAGMLAEIRRKLARNRDVFPLFDVERFRRHIEAAYFSMWQRCQRQEAPASFAVVPIDR
jgi:predicted O-linked N-acetylglucosamine transferase (SPINDLY family)